MTSPTIRIGNRATLVSAMLCGVAVLLFHTPGVRAEPQPLEGPLPAFVERVIDGDTLAVRVRIWLNQELKVLVRLAGIDTPELKGRCLSERRMARAARRFVQQKVGQRKIYLTNIRRGKYAGRVVANVQLATGDTLSSTLIQAGFAQTYAKRRHRGWCAAANPEERSDSNG